MKPVFSGCTLFYTESGANRHIAEAAGKKYNFRVREVALESARTSLPQIRGRAALLWGDGFEHQLSHFFEVREGRGLKFGVDAHTDIGDGHEIDFRNHFRHSAEGNHDVEVYLPYWRRGSYQLAESLRASSPLSDPITHTHVSVDLDFLEGFPCSQQFSSGSARIATLLNLMERLVDERTLRFDVGGMKHNPSVAELQNAMDAYMHVFGVLAEARNSPAL
jgi:hypothetical protein